MKLMTSAEKSQIFCIIYWNPWLRIRLLLCVVCVEDDSSVGMAGPWLGAMSCYLTAVIRTVSSLQSGENMILIISLSLSVLAVRASLHEAIDTYIIQTDYGNIRGYSKMVLDK